MFLLPPRTWSLAVRGIAGGITSGVTYLGIDPGGSVPPGTCASARCTANCHGNTNEAPATAPDVRNWRLESRMLIPPCSLGAYGYVQGARAAGSVTTMGSDSIGGPRAAGSDQPQRVRQARSRLPLGVRDPVMDGSARQQPQLREARSLAPHRESGGAGREEGKLDRIAT